MSGGRPPCGADGRLTPERAKDAGRPMEMNRLTCEPQNVILQAGSLTFVLLEGQPLCLLVDGKPTDVESLTVEFVKTEAGFEAVAKMTFAP